MKLVFRVIKWILFSAFGLVFSFFLLLALNRDHRVVELSDKDRQSIVARKEYSREADSNRYASLLEEFGRNKNLAEGFELQCLLALSHYPELKDAHIDFVVGDSYWPLSSRPEITSTILPGVQRRLLVLISSGSADFWEPILLKNVPFNAQVGFIGHELAHSVYYQDKTALALIGVAYRYEYDRAFYTEFERDADKLAVERGLGYQLYDLAWFIRKAFGKSQEEIEAEEDGGTYLHPGEIAREMKKYDFYKEPLDTAESYFSN